MFGFACDETPDLMPATLDYSHKILMEMAERPPFRRGAVPRARRQEPGHASLRGRQAGQGDRDRRLDPAQAGLRPGREAGRAPRLCEGGRRPRACRRAARQRDRLSHQPDRQLRDRRPRRRRRSHRPQDHRRHLWRRGAARRRRLLGQGPDQGRPLGRLCRALSRQEHRRRRPRQALHDPARLCDRRVASRCRSTSTRTAPARSATTRSRRRSAGSTSSAADPARHPHAPRPQQADLRSDRRLRPFRPQAATATSSRGSGSTWSRTSRPRSERSLSRSRPRRRARRCRGGRRGRRPSSRCRSGSARPLPEI